MRAHFSLWKMVSIVIVKTQDFLAVKGKRFIIKTSQ